MAPEPSHMTSSPSHLHPLDFDCSNLSSLSSTQLSLVHYHLDFDTFPPNFALRVYREWTLRRERSRCRLASSAAATDVGGNELHEIDLSFDLHDLHSLSSRRLAVIQFHPECTELIQLRAEMIWRGRRERDFSRGLVWEERRAVDTLKAMEDSPDRLQLQEGSTTTSEEVLQLVSHEITNTPYLRSETTQQTDPPSITANVQAEVTPLLDPIVLPSIDDISRKGMVEADSTLPREEEMEMEVEEEELSIRDVPVEALSATPLVNEVQGVTEAISPSLSAIQIPPTSNPEPSTDCSNPPISTAPPPPPPSFTFPPSKPLHPSPVSTQQPASLHSPSASPELMILATPFPPPHASPLPSPPSAISVFPLVASSPPQITSPFPIPRRPWGSIPLDPQFKALIHTLRLTNLPSSQIFSSSNLPPLFSPSFQPIAYQLLRRSSKEIFRTGYVGFSSFEERTLAFQEVSGKRLLGGNQLVGVEYWDEVEVGWEWRDLEWAWAEAVWRREVLREREEEEEMRKKEKKNGKRKARRKEEKRRKKEEEKRIAILPVEVEIEAEAEVEMETESNLSDIPPQITSLVSPTDPDTVVPPSILSLASASQLIPEAVLSTFFQLYISFKTLPKKLERRSKECFLTLVVLAIQPVGPVDPLHRKFFLLFRTKSNMLQAQEVMKTKYSAYVSDNRMKVKIKSSQTWTLGMFTKKVRKRLRVSMTRIQEEQEYAHFRLPSKDPIEEEDQTETGGESENVAQLSVTLSSPPAAAFPPNPIISAPFPSAFTPSAFLSSASLPSAALPSAASTLALLPSPTTAPTSPSLEAPFDPTRDQDSRLLPSGWSRCWSKTHQTWYYLDAKDVSSWTNPLTLTDQVAVVANGGREESSGLSAQGSRSEGQKVTANTSAATTIPRAPLPHPAPTPSLPFIPSAAWTPPVVAPPSREPEWTGMMPWYAGGLPWYPGIWDGGEIEFSVGHDGWWIDSEDKHEREGSHSSFDSASNSNPPSAPFVAPAQPHLPAPFLPVEPILRPFPTGHWGKSSGPPPAGFSHPLPTRPSFQPPPPSHAAVAASHFSNYSHQWPEPTSNAFGSTSASGSTSLPADYYQAGPGNSNGRMGNSGPVVGGKNKRQPSGHAYRGTKKNRHV